MTFTFGDFRLFSMERFTDCNLSNKIATILRRFDKKIIKTVTSWDSSYLSKKLHGKQEFTLKDLQKFVDAGFVTIRIKPSRKKIK